MVSNLTFPEQSKPENISSLLPDRPGKALRTGSKVEPTWDHRAQAGVNLKQTSLGSGHSD